MLCNAGGLELSDDEQVAPDVVPSTKRDSTRIRAIRIRDGDHVQVTQQCATWLRIPTPKKVRIRRTLASHQVLLPSTGALSSRVTPDPIIPGSQHASLHRNRH